MLICKRCTQVCVRCELVGDGRGGEIPRLDRSADDARWQRVIPTCSLEYVSGMTAQTVQFKATARQGPSSRLWSQARQGRDRSAQVFRVKQAPDTPRASQGPLWRTARKQGVGTLPEPCSYQEHSGGQGNPGRAPVSEAQNIPGQLLTQPYKPSTLL